MFYSVNLDRLSATEIREDAKIMEYDLGGDRAP